VDIRSKVMTALRWSAAARLLGQIFSWGVTIFVIRLLAPSDYGLMAMATVLVSGLFLLNTVGLDAVLVQRSDLDDHGRRQIFGAVLLVNALCFALLFFGAPVAARFYGEAALVPVLQVLATQFLVLGFETLPLSRLEREIDFAARSVVDLVTLVIGSLTTLVFALLGFGVWSLVWGMVVNTATRVAGLNLIAPCPMWPSFALRGMARHFAFGGFVSIDRGLWFVFSESDKFIGGRLLGQHALGYYAVASQIASLPIHKVTGLLNAIAFPAFSRTHAGDSLEKVREYLATATRVLAMVALPVFVGIAAVADSLVPVLLGEKWLAAAPLLTVLGLVMPLRLLSNVFPPLLWGINGRPRVSAENFLFAALVMPVAFLLGAGQGVAGLAWAWLLAYPFVFLFSAWRTCGCVALSLGHYLALFVRPALAALAMFGCVRLAAPMLGVELVPRLHLLLQIALGAVVYAAAAFLLDRKTIMEIYDLIAS